MNNLGHNIRLTIFGESHGPLIGLVVDGMEPGIAIDDELIKKDLIKRRGIKTATTSRFENDEYKIVSGVLESVTTGAPLTIIVSNENIKSQDYQKGLIRPGHADLNAHIKFGGLHDYRGGGQFSGRLTVALVVLGAILKTVLAKHQIYVVTHIKDFCGISDTLPSSVTASDLIKVNERTLALFNEKLEPSFEEALKKLAEMGDSMGASLETIVLGLPPGIGEPFFNSLESCLSHAIFSIPGIKGLNFGCGNTFYQQLGSLVNDQLCFKNGQIQYLSNHNGGICGGLSTGQPLIFTTTIRPTPTIQTPQQTINVLTGENLIHQFKGRHDLCFALRVPIIIEALTIFTICDLLGSKLWIKTT